jgi:hypothetical protein
MQLRLTPSEGEYKEKMRENLIFIKKKAVLHKGRSGTSAA